MDPFVKKVNEYGLSVHDYYTKRGSETHNIRVMISIEESVSDKKELLFKLFNNYMEMKVKEPSLFVEQFGISEDYKGKPDFYFENIGVDIANRKNGYKLSIGNLRGTMYFQEVVSQYIRENKNQYGMGRQYRMKAIFAPEKAEQEHVKAIVEHQAKMCTSRRTEMRVQKFHEELIKALEQVVEEMC